MIAEVIIDSKAKKLNRKFDYRIPENLEDIIETTNGKIHTLYFCTFILNSYYRLFSVVYSILYVQLKILLVIFH